MDPSQFEMSDEEAERLTKLIRTDPPKFSYSTLKIANEMSVNCN